MNPFSGLIAAQRAYFRSGATLSLEARKAALASLLDAVRAHENDVLGALHADLGKSPAEAHLTELGMALADIRHTMRHLKRWMRPRRMGTPLTSQPGLSRIYPEPLGVTLLFSPWNYPFQLCLLPLTAAVAAGNCVVFKPSQTAPATAKILKTILAEAFPPEHVAVVESVPDATSDIAGQSDIAHETATALLRERYDFIFYTGSPRVGHIIMEAAARHLTPVCLELGGKSPAIVTADADLEAAAKRIAWGKQMNAGQTCIAPDYVLADKRVKDMLMTLLRKAFTSMLGSDPAHNPAYARIINAKVFDRLLGLAQSARDGHAVTEQALRVDRESLKMAPYVLDAAPDDPIMQEEIFGPLLPVLPFDDVETALDFIRNGEKPLALYLFTRDKALVRRVMQTVPFGGGCVNDTLMHVGSHLPFGGVGNSGIGRYHGRAGFDLFSNLKGVIHRATWFDLALRYPPFDSKKTARIRRFIR